MPVIQTRMLSGVPNPFVSAPKSSPLSKPILRARRRPFQAPANDGPYRLPKAVLDRLEGSLAPFRNAEAAFALATFLARFWTAPNRLGTPFPADRRALAAHQLLGLSEAEIRGALKTLERLGFLNRPTPKSASRYQPTPEGLHRRPILFEFGTDFSALFQAANQKAKRTSDRRPPGGQPWKFQSSLPSRAVSSSSPKGKFVFEEKLMGQLVTPSSEGENMLEKSLARLAGALGLSTTSPPSTKG